MMRILVFIVSIALFGFLVSHGVDKNALTGIVFIGGVLAIPVMLLILGIIWFAGVLRNLSIDRRLRKAKELKQLQAAQDKQRQESEDRIRRDIAQGALAPKLRQAIAGGDLKFVEEVGRIDRRGMWNAFTADAEGNTPDHVAAAKGDAAMIECLASLGLAVIDRNQAGKTLLDVAPSAQAAAVNAAFCRGYARYLLRTKWRGQPSAGQCAALEEWIAELTERRHGFTQRQLSFLVTEEDCAQALVSRALAAAGAGDFERAERNAGLAGGLEAKLVEGGAREFVARSLAATDAKDFDRALKNAELAVSLAPHWPLALARRSTARADKHDYQGALTDCNEIVRLAPSDAQAYEARAAVHERMGETEKAMQDYIKALELDPSRSLAQERYNELIASA